MKTKIPKIIHQIWIGEEIPEKFKGFTNKMRDMHIPLGYEHKLWGNELWEKYADDPIIANYSKEDIQLAYVTDRFRMLILRDYGGIAVDPDCEIIKSFDYIMNKLSPNIKYFAGARAKIDIRGALFECGIHGSTPNSRVVRELLKVWDDLTSIPGGVKTSNKLISILNIDIALLNYEHFFTYNVTNETILLHEPHTLDSWRIERDTEHMQKRRKIIKEKKLHLVSVK